MESNQSVRAPLKTEQHALSFGQRVHAPLKTEQHALSFGQRVHPQFSSENSSSIPFSKIFRSIPRSFKIGV